MASGTAPDNRADRSHDGAVPATQNGLAGLSIRRWLRTQSLVAVVLALLLIPVGSEAAYSSMFGSLAAFIPAVFFAAYVGRRIGTSSTAFLQAAVVGEALKLALTALICMGVFKWVEPLAPGWFFAGMIAVIMAGWIGLSQGLNSGN